jgi:hypothetical protein
MSVEKKLRITVTTQRMEVAVALVQVLTILDRLSGYSSAEVIKMLQEMK